MDYLYYGYLALLALCSLVLCKALALVVTWLLSLLVKKTEHTLDEKILEEAKGPLELFFFLVLIYAGIHVFTFFADSVQTVDRYTEVAITLLIAFLAFKLVKAVSNWYYAYGHKTSRLKIELSLLPLLQNVGQLVIIVLACIMALGELGYDVSGIIALTSVAGLVLGLASQETLGNVFAGLALQLDRQCRYNDYFRLPTGDAARLKKIGMRSTKLVDYSGNAVIVSNSEFAKMKLTRIGTAGEEAVVPFAFEAPLSVPLSEIVSAIEARLKKEKPGWLAPDGGVSRSAGKTKAPGWYEATVSIRVADAERAGDAAAFVGDAIASLLRKRA